VARRLVAEPEMEVVRGASCARYLGKSFRIFAASPVTTEYALGEFYWKLKVGDVTEVSDYVSPPQILSREHYAASAETSWSWGEYVTPADLSRALGLEKPLPEPSGVYLNQPNLPRQRLASIRRTVWLALAALLLIQILYAGSAARKAVYRGDFRFVPRQTNATVVTPPFKVEGGMQALRVDLGARVSNSWLELNVDLVDAHDRKVVASFVAPVEYYFGSDSDGAWEEGSPNDTEVLPSVPGGEYYLVIEPSGSLSVPEIPFHLTVTRDVPVWLNFWLSAAVLLAYPGALAVRGFLFEHARWSQSDYSPYGSSSSDDDD